MYKELKITSSMLLPFVVLRRLLFYDSICYGHSADFSETADCFLSRLKHEGCVWFCSKVYPRVNPASGGKVACGSKKMLAQLYLDGKLVVPAENVSLDAVTP